jgi:hypothetical protein
MGKMLIEVDTDKKEMSVKVEGKAVANVREVYAYQGFNSKGEADGFSMSVTTVDGTEDIRKVTTYYASGSLEATEAEEHNEEVDKTTIPGFVGVPGKTGVQKDIESFMSQNR